MATHGFGYNHPWYYSHVQLRSENSFSGRESVCNPSSDASSQLFPGSSSYLVEFPACFNCNLSGHFSRDCPEQFDADVHCGFCGREDFTSQGVLTCVSSCLSCLPGCFTFLFDLKSAIKIFCWQKVQTTDNCQFVMPSSSRLQAAHSWSPQWL
jgi:hypothetical protein